MPYISERREYYVCLNVDSIRTEMTEHTLKCDYIHKIHKKVEQLWHKHNNIITSKGKEQSP